MKKNYFANAKNITSSIGINCKDGNLRRNDNISTENKNQKRYSSNSSLNYQINIQNQRQIQHNINETKQVNNKNIKKENQRIIINSRRNKLKEINNNLNRKVHYNINNNVHNCLNNNVNNHFNYYTNNYIIINMNNNQLDLKNGANNNRIRKNEEKFQNHSFYLSKYSNKNNKMSDISGSEQSHTNKTLKSEPHKKIGNHRGRKKEWYTKNLIRKITKLINAIESDRMDTKNHTKSINAQTEAINAQTEAINAQTEAIKAQTTEMRRQHEELMTLMSKTMTELNLNVKKLVDKYV